MTLLHHEAVSVFRSSWCVLVLLVLLGAVACSDDGTTPADETPAAETPTNEPPTSTEKLLAPQGNQLDVYDLATGGMTVLIPTERYNINGQACVVPDSSGNFLMGEDKGQPELRAGWGIFSPDGTMVQKIEEPVTPGEADQPEPFGCGFDSEERLFVTDVGSGSFEAAEGKLIVFFPPAYDTFCVLETELRVAGTVAIDASGSVYVPETAGGQVQRWAGPFPTSDTECEDVQPVRTTFIDVPEIRTPFSLTAAPNGNWYLSSVFLPTAIREYDADGNFVRTIIEGEDIGNPAGLAVASDGTIYYADLGLRQEPGELPGPVAGEGTVRRVTFDENGTPSLPEIIGSGLNFPDAVSVVPLP